MAEEDEQKEELKELSEDSQKLLRYKESFLLQTKDDETIEEEIEIWRYMDFFEFMHLIQNESLHFTNIQQFEDNYERILPNEIKSKIGEELSGYLGRDINTLIKPIDELTKSIEKNKKNLYVNCWSFNKDSYGLWKIYTKSSYYGIAVVTNIQKLCKCFSCEFNNTNKLRFTGKKIGYKITGDKVHYNWKTVDFFDFKNNKAVYLYQDNISFYKTKNYEFEKEYRVVLRNDYQDTGINLNIDVNELILKWYPSPFMPEWFIRDVLLAFMRNNYPNLFERLYFSSIKTT